MKAHVSPCRCETLLFHYHQDGHGAPARQSKCRRRPRLLSPHRDSDGEMGESTHVRCRRGARYPAVASAQQRSCRRTAIHLRQGRIEGAPHLSTPRPTHRPTPGKSRAARPQASHQTGKPSPSCSTAIPSSPRPIPANDHVNGENAPWADWDGICKELLHVANGELFQVDCPRQATHITRSRRHCTPRLAYTGAQATSERRWRVERFHSVPVDSAFRFHICSGIRFSSCGLRYCRGR